MNEKMTMSVTQLTKYIKALISYDDILSAVSVSGEISNLKYHSSGHIYFSLKDQNSLVKCVMFRSNAQNMDFIMKDGEMVSVFGRVDVYEAAGSYQIYVSAVKKAGLGDLYVKYTQLLEKLKAKGYFDEEHKKPLPQMPKNIALVTSKTSAAMRDMISVLRRRFPGVNILVCPVSVQGIGASEEIAAMIDYVNAEKLADLMIVGRGGGSFEDLFAFNEEIVANSVYHSQIPIISAVGHETDFTICDFTSDLRAPTPSVGAELAVSQCADIDGVIGDFSNRIIRSVKNMLLSNRSFVDRVALRRTFLEPGFFVWQSAQKLDSLNTGIANRITTNVKGVRTELSELKRVLESVSYKNTLKRGYSIVWQKNSVVKKTEELDDAKPFEIEFFDGKKQATIIKNKEEQ